MVSARPLVPLILGPTAAGKSAVAMAVAQRWPTEIVSADSAQVYRGFDIGTAKPTAADRARVPHHLIDLVSADDPYSAARFAVDACRAIDAIVARGRLPLVVGGTMLYVKALIEGLHDLPVADPTLRRELEDDARRLGWPAMHARLASLDPPTAARLEPADSQRIQRALEVCLISGQPMSSLLSGTRRRSTRDADADAPDGSRHEPVYLPIALLPSDRAVLHQRIDRRFRQMIADGLIEEVRGLRSRGTLSADLPALRAVGYRQVWAWLAASDGDAVAASDRSTRGRSTRGRSLPPIDPVETMIQQGIAATRQLAKRQLTWLRSMPQCERIDCLAPDVADQVIALIDSKMQPRP